MKRLKAKRLRMIAFLATFILLITAGMAMAVDLEKGAVVTVAAGLTIGGVELSEKEEAFLNVVKDQVKSLVEKNEKGYISDTKLNETLTAKWKEWSKELSEGDLKKLNDALDKQGLEIVAIKEHATHREELKSLPVELINAYNKNIDKITALREKGGMISFDVKDAFKAVGTMTTANVTGESGLLETLEAGLTRIVRRIPFLRQLMNVATTTSPTIQYVEYTSPEGDPGQTAEGVKKTQVDFDLVVRKADVKKTTAFIKVSEEMIEDVPFIQGEINNDLMERLELKIDSQLLSGDGDGENLKGVLEYAPDFAAGTFASTVSAANRFDVIKVAVATIISNHFIPNYIVLNPLDVASMELTKSTDGHYVFPPFSTADGTRISGIPVIQNTGITAGDFLVGDFSKSNFRVRKDATLKVGYENDDFTKNLMTILVEARTVHYIKNNHLNAFVQGDFATAIAAITSDEAAS